MKIHHLTEEEVKVIMPKVRDLIDSENTPDQMEEIFTLSKVSGEKFLDSKNNPAQAAQVNFEMERDKGIRFFDPFNFYTGGIYKDVDGWTLWTADQLKSPGTGTTSAGLLKAVSNEAGSSAFFFSVFFLLFGKVVTAFARQACGEGFRLFFHGTVFRLAIRLGFFPNHLFFFFFSEFTLRLATFSHLTFCRLLTFLHFFRFFHGGFEILDTSAECAANFRQFPGPENNHDDDQDDHQFWKANTHHVESSSGGLIRKIKGRRTLRPNISSP